MNKLDKNNIEDILALTPMQEGMLFHYLQEPEGELYFEQLSLNVSGKIDIRRFENAWNFVIKTNEMLRVVFRWEKVENPIQIILKEYKLQPGYYDFSGGEPDEVKKRLEDLKVKDRKDKFDLREVPFRVTLCKIEKSKYEMIISNHHIIYDGWSNGRILKEFFKAYDDLSNGKALVKPVKTKFEKFVKWIQKQHTEERGNFWRNHLKEFDSQTELSIKRRNTKGTIGTGKYQIRFETNLKNKLEDFVKAHKITLASVLYSSWGLLLQKYNNSDDVIFGTTVSGRSAKIKKIEEIVGLFINTIPIRIKTKAKEKIGDVLQRVHDTLQVREKYESTPLVDIKKYSQLDHIEELFDSIVIIENYPLDSRLMLKNCKLSIDSYSMLEMTHYHLSTAIEIFNEIGFIFTYNKELFDEDTIVRLSHHLSGIVKEIITNPGMQISELGITSKQEKHQVLYEFNSTAEAYPEDRTITELFEEQVKKTPDSTAIVGGKRITHVTYEELNRNIHQLARKLIVKGIKANDIVGIIMERSIEMIIGILGILKAGAAYMPIVPNYPEERLNHILEDSSVHMLVTTNTLAKEGENRLKGEKILLDAPPVTPMKSTTYNLPPLANAPFTSLAYIIYTSGSTGRPKGVMVEQLSVVNVLTALQEQYPLMERDVYLFKTSVIFDVSVAELFGWFFGGGRLALLEKGGEKDPGKILDVIAKAGVTHINFVPSMFNVFVDSLNSQNSSKLSSLKYIFLAGESLLPGLVTRLRELNTRITLENIYGPTEGTVYSSWYSLGEWAGKGNIPIGKPLPNVQIYILDKYDHLQPVGVPGELCISGAGLARGYLNRPELTARKFQTPDKSEYNRSYWSYKSCILYKTGDLAMWMPDGNVEFLGRIDRQIKVRGFRIELGEIENQLLKHSKIRKAVVLVGEDKVGDRYLCAYIVPALASSGETFDVTGLRNDLVKFLPDYMIPSYFVGIDEVPLTPSGKIDRKALPKPQVKTIKKYIAPRDKREALLVEIWSQVLGIEKETIGIDDNFFELGGHSLKMVSLMGRIHQAFDIEIPFSVVFEIPTIRQFCHYIRDAEMRIHHTIQWAEEKEYYPLIPIQKRFYVFQQLNPDDISYNMTETMLVEGQLSREKFEGVFRQLLLRHESLRTSFHMIKGEPVQKVHQEVEIAIEYDELYKEGTRGLVPLSLEPASCGSQLAANTIKEFIRPFDLTRLPLWRMGLIKTAPHKHLLIFDMHHLIGDGTSNGIFIRDFLLAYKQEPLPPLKVRYRDFVEWQRWKREQARKSSWQPPGQDQPEDQLLNLPTDFPRPVLPAFAGNTIRFEIGVEESEKLHRLSIRQDVTLYMVLLAIYNVLLSKLSGQETIAVGSPIAGRLHVDLDHMVGLFLNTLCLRNQPLPYKAFSAFLQEVKARAIAAFENQDYQYDELVAQVNLARDKGRNPLFDVMLVLQNMEMPEIDIPGLKVTRELGECLTSKFDMTLFCEEKDLLVFKLEYSCALFKPGTINRFIRYFQKIISRVLQDPHQKIVDIEMIPEEEKQQILYEFNDTEADYPHEQTIHHLFTQQAERTPDRIALVGSDAARGRASLSKSKPLPIPMSLTYRELNQKSNQLARLLRGQGVKSDTIVGVMMERSPEMVFCILGILKAGGAYLPIDVDYPEERVRFILADSNVKLLVSTNGLDLDKKIGQWEGEIILITPEQAENREKEFSKKEHRLLLSLAPAASLAYIIYTSGSTGKPKGVLLQHCSVVNILLALFKKYPLLKEDTYLLKTTYTFDVSVSELFGWYLGGGRLAILEQGSEKDPLTILDWIERIGVTHINFVPSMFGVFLEILESRKVSQLSNLKYIFLAGEALAPHMVTRFNQFQTRIILENIYGPTESTIYASQYSLLSWRGVGSIPIGKPLSNTRLYILNPSNQLQAIGVSGELWIGGEGLARGYLNRPGLTAEKFDHDLWDYHDYQDEKKSNLSIKNHKLQNTNYNIQNYKQKNNQKLLRGSLNQWVSGSVGQLADSQAQIGNPLTMMPRPHPETNEIQNKRLAQHIGSHRRCAPGRRRQKIYKTGDLTRWLPDGNIEFLGRIDNQVKIRGFRIELGEIETQLSGHESIKEAVVLVRENEGNNRYLCAYIISNQGLSASELREYLSLKLPDYMIPSYFVRLDQIPLTPNGKIDRKALPKPEMRGEETYTAPRDEVERKLADLWIELLSLRHPVGIDDNFFQLGGHSLKVIILTSRMDKAFHINIPLAEVFRTPTIRGLSAYIKSMEEGLFASIEPVEEKDYHALSSAQKRLYFLHQMDKGSTGYNMTYTMRLDGGVSKNKLEEVFLRLLDRHESLRTSFQMSAGVPAQRIHDDVEFKIEYYQVEVKVKVEGELSPLLEGTGGLAPLTIIKNFIRPFDLSLAPLLRVGLIKESDQKHILMVDMHHIISDGISTKVLVQDFMALYSNQELPEMRLQYKDYTQWQNRGEESERIRKQAQYWKKEFEGEIPVFDLPMDYPRPTVQRFEGNFLSFAINKEHTRALNTLALDEGTSLYMVLLALYTIFLSKISNQEDIVIGAPVAGRRHADLERIIGMFVNTLALRHFPRGEKRFIAFLAEVKEKTLQAFENQDYPFEDLVELVEVNRDAGRNPLFDVMLVWQNLEQQELKIPGLKLEEYPFDNKKSKFDMTLTGVEGDNKLHFILTYNTALFNKKTIRRFIRYFQRMVSDILENPAKLISGIDILAQEEKKQLLIDFNDTVAGYPEDKTIHQLFEFQAEKTPDKIAIVGGWNYKLAIGQEVFKEQGGKHTIQVTYKDLNEKSNQLTRLFKDRGVAPDMIVGIMTEPSLAMIIGIMTILKAGCAYLPIDPKHPEDRIIYMINDSETKLLLTQTPYLHRIPCEIESINIENSQIYKGKNTNLEYISGPVDLLYTIYTSGSTGKPKGVLLEHKNLVNYVSWFTRKVALKERDRTVLTSSFGFDLGYTSLYSSILSGCQLHIPGEEIYLSPKNLMDYIVKHEISYLKLTPSLFSTIIKSANFTTENSRSLRLVVLGGEEMKLSDVEKAHAIGEHIRIMNHYGPTEATIGCVAQLIDFNKFDHHLDRSTIGNPISNMKAVILNKSLKLIAVGTAGELCVSGEGAARGYLNRPDLTFEKFIPHPYIESERIYRTGDLARWLPGGAIEFLGRIDNQVKIRGYRIELEEIETRILIHPLVKEAAVILRQYPSGDKYLCAYIVFKPGRGETNLSELKEYLSETLPDYMIPSFFVDMDLIPLTPNGKLNRKLLPEPDMGALTASYTAPRDPVEKRLAEVWQEILEVDRIGIDDHFIQLGGHSLKAIILISRIDKAFHVNVPMTEIFRTPTIRGLAAYIKSREEGLFTSIEPVEEKDYHALSSAQKRLYILHQMDECSIGYNMPYVVRLDGEMNKNKFKEIFLRLIARHESLRTSFLMPAGVPVQRIHDDVEFKIEYDQLLVNCQGRGGVTSPIKVEKIIRNFIRPFDLSRAPLLRVGLIKESDQKHILVVDMHHIISDGISRRILVREFMALAAGKNLPPLRLQYKDFSQWQNRETQREVPEKQKAYWKKQLEGEIPLLDLPCDYVRPMIQRFEGSTVTFAIDQGQVNSLRSLIPGEDFTLYMIILAIYYILLCKLGNQEDILVGTPTVGRRHADLQQIIGMFVNTLVLRNYPTGDKTYIGFLREIKKRSLEAFENQDYPYEELVEEVAITRDTVGNPLFDTMFVMQNMGNPRLEIPGLRLLPCEHQINTSKFDVTLIVTEKEENLSLTFEYSTHLFKKATIERFAAYLKKIASTIISNPEVKICDVEILGEEERREIIYDFNNTTAEYPRNKVIDELFAEQAERTPNHIAVIGQSVGAIVGAINQSPLHQITYKEFNKRSNRLAYFLKEKGVEPDTIVGIMVERAIEMIVGIMGILKAGGAYLPIDPGYPEERKRYILKDSGGKILLTGQEIAGFFSPKASLNLSEGRPFNSHHSSFIIHHSCYLAYIIYTSGSTGKPKGVAVEHHSVVNRLNWMQRFYPIGERDVILQKTTFTFDVSVWELFWWSWQGASVCLLKPGGEKEPKEIADAIEMNNVTTLHFVPSMLSVFLDYIEPPFDLDRLSTLRQIFSSGEALLLNQVDRLNRSLYAENKTKLINLYGPTEATVDVSYFNCYTEEKLQKIPIGRPIDNIELYIMDISLKLQPVGITGELCISGVGLARGYLNRPELTAEKFDHDLWDYHDYKDGYHRSYRSYKSYALYKTGDLARWLVDGNIEFLGRIDHQVKIRGFRIELGEIENQLLKHNQISEAVVVSKEDEKGDGYLCAYIVPIASTSNEAINITDLRNDLSMLLPDYMIPPYFVALEAFPLTPSGKVDRKALPEPDKDTGATYVAPRDEMEEKLAHVWSEVLGIEKDKIGIETNFFELGGHSLKVITLAAMIHKEFDVKVTLGKVFKAPKISALARYLKGKSRKADEGYMSIEVVEKKEYYPLSSAQKRLFLVQQMEIDSTSYNIPRVFVLEGKISKEKLKEIFGKLIKRHDSMRTSFVILEGEPLQRINKDAHFDIEYFVLEKNSGDMETRARCILKSFIRPFNLSHPPLLRVGIINIGEMKNLLMIDIHHIISDGTSIARLTTGFISLYMGQEQNELRLQYKDCSEWQNSEKRREAIRKQEKYWLKEFEGEIPVLNLPTDSPRPPIQKFDGDRVSFEMENKTTLALKAKALECGVTLYMLLIAAANVLLSKLSGQEDIVIGTPIAGRVHPDLEGIIGMFVNTLALRNYPKEGKTFSKFLEEIKERILDAFENQDYQFEDLVRKVAVNRDMSRNALFDIMFILQNFNTNPVDIEGEAESNFKMKPFKYTNMTSKFDLTLTAVESGEQVYFTFEYCTKLFKKKTIQRFIGYFKKIISALLEEPGKRIADIEIMLGEEKRQILFDFNNTNTELPRDKCYHQLFETQVIKNPDKIAGKHQNRQITYQALNETGNRLAHYLLEHGTTPNSIIGVYMKRSLSMLLSILAIFKAGGTYLPLEIDYPPARIQYILKNSDARILFTREDNLEIVETIKDSLPLLENILCLEPEGKSKNVHTGKYFYPDSFRKYAGDNPNIDSTPDNLAYLMYTSGTTGNPKGVMIHQLGMINHIYAKIHYFSMTAEDLLPQTGPACFDISIWQFLASLLLGGYTFIIDTELFHDLKLFLQTLNLERITILEFVPSWLNGFLEMIEAEGKQELNYLEWMVSTGDVLGVSLARRWFNYYPGIKLVNTYGPTEASDDIAHYTLEKMPGDDQETIPVGKALDNLHVYVLDRNLKLCPIGVRGEVCVAGIGVGKGYWKDQSKTKKSFIANPYVKEIGSPDYARIYKMGDIGYFREDGNLECLGRVDHLVKIGGNRIELGEIENHLLNYEDIKEAVVLAKENSSRNKYLCAYITADIKIEASDIREYLLDKLPAYMIPGSFVFLEKMPLNPNGKIDRKALLQYNPDADQNYVSPQNEVEETMARIWSEVLNVDKKRIGIHDNFFQLGGHSFKAIGLVNKIHKSFKVEIPFVEIFKNPTIKSLSDSISKIDKSSYSLIRWVEEKEYYELSSAQKQMYILQQLDESSTAYNIPTARLLKGEVDIDKLKTVFYQLINRHESLRTSFFLADEKPVQKVHPPTEITFEIENYHLGHHQGTDENRLDKIINCFVRSFDLSRAPLLRVGLISIEKNQYFLLVDIHHIIADLVSIEIFMEDFASLYVNKELPGLKLHYKDFSQWKNHLLRSGKIKKQEEYWLGQFADGIPDLELPLDYPRTSGKNFEGEALYFDLTEEMTEKIKELARQSQTSMYIVLLSVFNILLSRYTAAEDIVVASPMQGRTHADWQNIIGMFVNMVVMRNQPQAWKTFTEFCQEIKVNTLRAFENQDYPFERLSRKLQVRSDTNRNPLTDIVFDYKNIDSQLEKSQEMQSCGLVLESYQIEHNISKFDLLLNAYQSTRKINFRFTYSSKIFKRETIENMICHLKNIIREVVTNPGVKISEIEMLAQEENKKLMKPSEDEMALPIYEESTGARWKTKNLEANFDL
ncbi:MAG: non-ribosomal peptide synthase/polyketide synthase [Candidatus Aminicenantes bacterium]|jgi:amino acid adenylation domain-containing protein